MAVGCLWYPGASTIGSQLLDRDLSHGWEILATQPWAPTRQGRKQASVTLRTKVEKGKGAGGVCLCVCVCVCVCVWGGGELLINGVPTFVIHPQWIKHTKSCRAHQNGRTLYALDLAKRCTLVPEREGSWYMRFSHTPLASKIKQALLVVNCVKLKLKFKLNLNCVLNLRQILPCENKDRQTLGQRFSLYIKW